MIRVLSVLVLAFVLAGALARAGHDAEGGQTVINGQPLSAETLAALGRVYGPIPAGDYWYDAFSGLWGVTGGPSTGRILPGLALGGPLRPDASGGGDGTTSGVFINGREIHPGEHQYLVALFGAVDPGRYWLGPTLVGGIEGGPPLFDLRAAAAAAAGGSGYNNDTLFGGLMSDGQCSGYLPPGGTTVMTGNC